MIIWASAASSPLRNSVSPAVRFILRMSPVPRYRTAGLGPSGRVRVNAGGHNRCGRGPAPSGLRLFDYEQRIHQCYFKARSVPIRDLIYGR
jgi:hypothetical protein